MPKTTLEPNWQEDGQGEHPQNFGTPCLFLQPLKLATSSLVHNLGMASSLPKKQRLGRTLVGAGWATGAPQKLCVPGTMYPVPHNTCRNIIKLQM